jgi:hypothetical protein
MLMCYPSNARSLSLIGKAICGFAHLLHVHPSVTLARVIVKALVNSKQDIPDDFGAHHPFSRCAGVSPVCH